MGARILVVCKVRQFGCGFRHVGYWSYVVVRDGTGWLGWRAVSSGCVS